MAVDLDGTLLNDAKQITGGMIRAAATLRERGVRLVIASARPPRSVRAIHRALGLDTWQINYNGALIWDDPASRAVYHRPLDCAIARAIIADARDQFDEVLVSCEVMDRWFTDRLDNTYTTETGRVFKPDLIAPIDEFCRQPITKLMLLGPPPLISRLEPLIEAAWAGQIAMVRTDEELLQIMHPRVGKASALKKVAAHYDTPLEQVMAIGDAPNDVGMLQLAGRGVAVANAHARTLQVADWVAPSNNDEGVLAALRWAGLVE